jgi:hypothetical protein
MAGTLTEDDKRKYGCYMQLVGREGENLAQQLARAKMTQDIWHDIQRLEIEWRMSMRFHEAPLFQEFPELVSQLDRHELLSASLFAALPDALKYRRRVVTYSGHLHHWFRRKLSQLASSTPTTLKVRVDPFSKTSPVASYIESLEEARAYGRSFDLQQIHGRLYEPSIPSVYERLPPSDVAEACYDKLEPIERLEVLRTERSRENYVSFLIEELKPFSELNRDIGYIETRIFHCDSKIGSGQFDHVDASVLTYDVETYRRRLTAHLKDKISAENHTKLFWHGPCGVDIFQELLLLTFPRNELVGEFLTGQESVRPLSLTHRASGP